MEGQEDMGHVAIECLEQLLKWQKKIRGKQLLLFRIVWQLVHFYAEL